CLLFIFLYNLLPIFSHTSGTHYLVGASAGVTAIIIGTATFAPHYAVYLFGVLRVELRWIAVFRVFFDLLGATGTDNQGGFIAHLGGAIFGLLYILHIKGSIHIPLIDNIAELFRRKKARSPRPVRSASVNINREKPVKNWASQEEIDRILDKINKSGYDSLSKEEKETLFRAGDN
ncbi:MAG: rhomboid family intramembrane serine protease, partial [Bacteroidia bacterium]|nr:rhomboid family intramembrane serine protease [Bacteroidia bacterium]